MRYCEIGLTHKIDEPCTHVVGPFANRDAARREAKRRNAAENREQSWPRWTADMYPIRRARSCLEEPTVMPPKLTPEQLGRLAALVQSSVYMQDNDRIWLLAQLQHAHNENVLPAWGTILREIEALTRYYS